MSKSWIPGRFRKGLIGLSLAVILIAPVAVRWAGGERGRGEIGAATTGAYFEQGREVRCGFANNRDGIEGLYDICLGYVPR